MRRTTLATIALVGLLAFSAGFAVGKGPRLLTLLLTGGSAANPEWQRLASVQAFDQLIASVDDIRTMVLAEAESEREVVQGMRWILRNLAMTADIAGDANVMRPHFARMDTDARKIGGDNPDGEYALASIDGRYAYRITGNRGSVRYFSLNVNAGRGATDRRMAAFVNDQTIDFDDQGNFDLILSQSDPGGPGQWVQIPEDASSVMLRQYLADRSTEELVRIHIEALDAPTPLPHTSDSDVSNAITAMNYAFIALATLHKTVLPESWDRPNTFFTTDADTLGGDVSTPDNLYMIGSYRVGRDEALIIEVTPPDTRYWNIALETYWHETVDYLHRPASRTLEDVVTDDDGKVRFVIAHTDLGVPNRLDSMGNERGVMVFRWLDARGTAVAEPQVRLVKTDEVHAGLSEIRRN